jgi:X-Pro dipeptidyl-peptidase
MLVTAAAAVPAGGAPTSKPNPPPIRPKTTDRYQALPEETIFVPTRGGDVYVQLVRPRVPAGKRVPVILTYTPYAAFGTSAEDPFFVPKGYARAVAHVVGTGNSGGCWDYGGLRERVSGYDLVEYLGTRSWSNGRVGMIGGSYDGTTANMVAADNAPHLATIVPEVAISAWYGYAYFGGVRYFIMDPVQRQGAIIDEQGFDTPAGFDFGFGLVPPLAPDSDPKYGTHVSERPCPDVKLEHLQRGYNPQPDYDRFWMDRDYGRLGSNLARRDGREITMLVQGEWRDYNVKHSESARMFRSVPVDRAATARDEGVPYSMFVMGQGAHGSVDPDFRFERILHAWFDQFLYGFDTNITRQPPSMSKANDGVIRRDASWPPPGTGSVPLYLRSGSGLSTKAPGAGEGNETYRDTALTTESFALAVMGEDAGQAGVLSYVSSPLKRDLRIAGQPRLDLYAATSETSTHFTPVLFDLGPPVTTTPSLCTFIPPQDACVVSRGFLNARYRGGLGRGVDVAPGQRYRASVGFIDNDWILKKGHRIAVAVMSSNLWWALPDTQRAINTIFHQPGAASALVLPVVGGPAAARSAGL